MATGILFVARRRLMALVGATALILGATLVPAQDLASFEEKTTVHVLDNGWTFIISERPVAPVFSFATLVNVGAAQEVPGITGLAHMFEHMAFKGTPNIGTSNYKAEKRALQARSSPSSRPDSWRSRRRPMSTSSRTSSATSSTGRAARD